MNNIIKIFLRDIYKLRVNIVALIIVIGVTLLPAMYAWFNLAANWDPYSNTAGIKVAVACNDTGKEVMATQMNAGSEIVNSLKQNDKIGWVFTSEKKALEGVKLGDYYAAIVIPSEFTEDMLSFLNGDFKNPEIVYYVNEKKNAIAPKITDAGINLIHEEVNKTFISKVTETMIKYFNLSDLSIDENGLSIIDRLMLKLKSVDGDLKDYSMTIDSFISANKAVSGLLKAASAMTPNIEKAIKDGNSNIKTLQNDLTKVQKDSATLGDDLNKTLSALQIMVNDLGTTANSALTSVQGAETGASNALKTSINNIDDIIRWNNDLIVAIEKLHLPNSGTLISNLQNIITSEKNIKALLQSTSSSLDDSVHRIETNKTKINQITADANTKLNDIKTDYATNIQPKINRVIGKMQVSLSNFGGVLSSAEGSISNINDVFDGINTAMLSGTDTLTNSKVLIQNLRNKIHKLTREVESVGKDKQVSKLLEMIKSDPEIYGGFMSSPVNIKNKEMFSIANYGSAMTPFYSILAIWVGAIVLVAIFKTNVKEDEKIYNIRHHESYFGRYLLFFIVGQLQALIICLGDLFFLDVQCENPILFILTGALASFIFTSLVYTLTVSFGAIGKALSVILLVVQIAGAGGTFPVEMLPKFFQDLNGFFPFTYAINAMRETIGGVYPKAYVHDMLMTTAFLIPTLILGLLLRKPLIKLTAYFEERMEDSEIM
ncbi:MAG: YhgE/Pip domain-containing protein [Anaerovoracaceae bacterium]